MLRALLLIAGLSSTQGAERATTAVHPAFLGICDAISFDDLQGFVSKAVTQLTAVQAISNPLLRSVAQASLCSTVFNSDQSPVSCLSDAVVDKTLAICKHLGSCIGSQATLDSVLAQMCTLTSALSCQPAVCKNKPSGALAGVMVGCFDVDGAPDHGNALRWQFGDTVPQKLTAVQCAALCGLYPQFMLEDGACHCVRGRFNQTTVMQYAVDSAQCGDACAGEAALSAALPCGEEDKLGVFNTAAVAKLGLSSLAVGRSLKELEKGHAVDGAWAWLLALSSLALPVGAVVIAVGRRHAKAHGGAEQAGAYSSP